MSQCWDERVQHFVENSNKDINVIKCVAEMHIYNIEEKKNKH